MKRRLRDRAASQHGARARTMSAALRPFHVDYLLRTIPA
jgi:hypothetical protein